jgi:two-component system, cell cycle sensor histidine kinase and response regulator CckA
MSLKDFPQLFVGHYDYLLREVLESIDDAVLVFGHDENVIYANPAAGDVFGAADKRLIGANVRALVPKDNYKYFRDIVALLNGPEHHALELRGKKEFMGQRANGHVFFAEGRLAKFNSESAYILVLRDITMRRAVEEELETALAHLKIVGSKVEYRFEHPKLLDESPPD